MDATDTFIEPKTAGVAVGCSYRPSIDNLAGIYCACTLLGRHVCKRVDVYIITLSCTCRIYALSQCLLVNYARIMQSISDVGNSKPCRSASLLPVTLMRKHASASVHIGADVHRCVFYMDHYTLGLGLETMSVIFRCPLSASVGPRVKCGLRTCGPATGQNAAANPNLNLNYNANSYPNPNPKHKP